MFKRMCLITVSIFLLVAHSPAQTTNGLITGTITDASGAVVAGVQVDVTNQGTGLLRTTKTDDKGYYIVPQVPPGIYDISLKMQGFASVSRPSVQLQVNQSATLDFKLTVSSTTQTVEVTGAPPVLDTTSATLATVIDQSTTVDLPLNGREFTQLTLLSPGAAPEQNGQQGAFTVALGAGGISPSVNGQRGEQNNFTMDGVLNNSIFTNSWAIAPPPDAIQEFAVQSHITDAQFSISSGANINVVTRSGTNAYHGAVWEFVRNDALDAKTYPASTRLPYTQNQYGVYLGGPVIVPRLFNGRNNTWASGYWEGFRSSLSQTRFGSTLTAAMRNGDFSGVLGASVGTDSLGRPEFANQIYDPATSRPDPSNPGQFLRDPFSGNMIPPGRINPASLLVLKKYFPLPNLNVAENILPNFKFTGINSTDSDVTGIRIDHRFRNNDTLFGRYNRANANASRPEQLPSPGFVNTLSNYAQTYALGFTHLFGTKTILNLHYGYTQTNDYYLDGAAGAAGSSFNDSINFSQASPARNGIALGPQIGIANGFSGVSQFAIPLGPQKNSDIHADLSKVAGSHTISVGGMIYHIHSFDDGWGANISFAQNATAQGGTSGPTGFGAASFVLGIPNNYAPWVGNTAADQTINWYGGYVQDQWQALKKLSITVGLRYDYVGSVDFHKVVSALDVLTGKFIVTGPVPPNFPKATGNSGFFNPQYNGYEPRFGVAYQASSRTVIHGAFAMLDDHNNTLVQENQNIRLSWPTGIAANLTSLDLGLPTTFLDKLPSAASLLSSLQPYASYGADPNNKIPYALEFNVGVQQQLTNTLNLKLDYVGSLSRHQYLVPEANTALFPGPGPISARQPFPQYGGPFSFSANRGPGSYNALQTQLQKSLSAGLFFMASYTWSKSLDWASDPYSNDFPNFYNLKSNWGPSSYNRTSMLVLTAVYALPVGRGKDYLASPNRFVQGIAGGWNVGSIVTLNSGAPFNASAGGDVANTGGPSQRAQRTGANPYSVSGPRQTTKLWLNQAGFTKPVQYTFGNERRNDLVGPRYNNVDFNAFKNFSLTEAATLQFRGELFNALNHTNYNNPDSNVQSPSFGQIFGAHSGREIQFAVKLVF